MGIYTDAVMKNESAKASNVGAITNVVGNVAMTLGGIASVGLGAGMTKVGISAGGEQGLKNALLGQDIEKIGAQLIGRQVGGFSGIVISSNITSAYQNFKHGEQLRQLSDTTKITQSYSEKVAKMPSEWLRQQFSNVGQELKKRKKEDQQNNE